MRKASWPEARNALERAKSRLCERGSHDIRGRLDRGARDLELAERLDAIRLTGYTMAVFLDFNKGAFYQGERLFGAVHLAYYHGGLSLESEWNFGRFQMTRPGLANKPEIPVQGFHTTLGYFVTGEQIERRTTVVPLRPFRPLAGRWGPGAIEPFVRYSQLNLGDIIFKDDLADGRLWTNDVSMVDLGVNWYPNRWIKFYVA